MFKGGIPENAELLLGVTWMAIIERKKLSMGNGKIWMVLCKGEGGEVEMETGNSCCGWNCQIGLGGREEEVMGDVG